MNIEIQGSPDIIDDKDIIRFIYDNIFKNLRRIKKGRSVKPLLLIKSGSKVHTLPVKFRNENEKKAWKMMVYSFCNMVRAQAVIFIKDCFLSVYRGDDLEGHLNHKDFVLPRDDPDKIDALMVMVVTPDLSQNVLTIRYYNRNGTVEFDEKVKWVTGSRAIKDGIIYPWEAP